jgi:hypothetical protein
LEFEIEFRDDADGADVEIRLSGSPTPESFREFTETLGRDPRYRAGLRMLVDLSTFDAAFLTGAPLQDLAGSVLERDWYHPPAAVAIIAPAEQLHAAALAYRAHLGGSRSNRNVFHTREEAMAWLTEQPRPRADDRR